MKRKSLVRLLVALLIVLVVTSGGFFLATAKYTLPIASHTKSTTVQTTPTGASGITGKITRGPTTPVCRSGTPCDGPYQATIIVQTLQGQTVTTFTSESNGSFTVSLQPGTYRLLSTKIGFPRMTPQQVTVQQGVFTTLHLLFDSGLR